MRLNQFSLNVALLGALVLGSTSVLAANQNCGLSQNCAAQTMAQPVQKTTQQKNKSAQQLDTLAYYLENLELTPEQMVLLRKVQESQVPMILLSKRNLDAAHAKLREMAMKNTYDQTLADQLAQVIANHTANLAVLQAQREYELFSVLSDEQVARYETLAAQIQ